MLEKISSENPEIEILSKLARLETGEPIYRYSGRITYLVGRSEFEFKLHLELWSSLLQTG